METGSTQSTRKVSFEQEIISMLHAFGDSSKPSLETGSLIEMTVYSYVCSLLVSASDVALSRISPSVGLEEFIFILRKQTTKLSRFLHHFKVKDMKSNLSKNMPQSDSSIIQLEDEPSCGHSAKQLQRHVICQNFIQMLDNRGGCLMRNVDKFDNVRQRRQEKAEKQTRQMDAEQYLQFTKCRQVSFSNRIVKFMEWFETFLHNVDRKPSSQGWEALAFLAHDYVADIVDVSLLVQRERLSINVAIPEYSPNNEPSSGNGLERVLSSHKSTLTTAHVLEAIRRTSSHLSPPVWS